MALLDAIGFRAYDSVTKRFTTVTVSGSTMTIGAYGPGSSAGFRIAVASGGISNTSEIRQTVAQSSTLAVEFGFRVNKLPSSTAYTIAHIDDGSTIQCDLALLSTGQLRIRRGGSTTLATSTFVAAINTRYRIGWKTVINDATGQLTLKINGAADASINGLTGLDTKNSSNATANQVCFGGVLFRESQMLDFDNIVIDDSTLHDEATVLEDLPTGTGSQDDGVPTGAADTRQAVDDSSPDDDATFSALQNVGDKFLLTYPNLPSGSVVLAAGSLTWAKKSAAGTALFKPDMKIGATEYLGTEFAPSDGSYAYFKQLLETSPATSSAWTESEINGMELGAERTG